MSNTRREVCGVAGFSAITSAGGYITDSINNTFADVPGITDVDVQIIWDPPWNPVETMSDWAMDQLGWKR